jgi:hypothetical protein
MVAAADADPVNTSEIDVNVVLGGRCCRYSLGLGDSLEAQSTRPL